ncbi:MAG: RNB domain-containing ribonuclease [Acidimicrobiales bacterium]|nr:RNB domain-containing ribonuclease [Acidimicrobiales bacterium]
MLHRIVVTDPSLDFDAIRADLDVPTQFPPEVTREAQHCASRTTFDDHVDRTDLELVTIDPLGARDLDQAVAIESTTEGWRVHYAIVDVAAWVEPGGLVDDEARRRTQTFYAPDQRTPLYPPVLSESAASLLPGNPRPAVLWTIDVDASGDTTNVELQRAMVQSRAQLDYRSVQDGFTSGEVHRSIVALREIGPVLIANGLARGAIDLGLPEQEVVGSPEQGWSLQLRADLEVEKWNAQISLLTGRSAATMMVDRGLGILRTLPAPDPALITDLAAAAKRLGIEWPNGVQPGKVLAGLDTSEPPAAAFAETASGLLRGAGYTVVRGTATTDHGHGGVGAPYAHVTAPLRRLADRFATEICLSGSTNRPVPTWVDEALDTLPTLMAQGDRKAKKFDRAVVDGVESLILSHRVDEVFTATVVDSGEQFGEVVLNEPPVRARCDGEHLPLGQSIRVRCVEADQLSRKVRFERVP